MLNVTWHDGVAVSRWLSVQEGHSYRQPTAAEWVYACRAGSDTRYGGVRAPSALATVANTFDSTAAQNWPQFKATALAQSDGFAFTAPLGSFAATNFGLYDMVGSAWEWEWEWEWVSYAYDENYDAASPNQDPQGPAASASAMRVRRGGSWHTWGLHARCSYRNINTGSSRYTLLGMRLVRDVNTNDH